MRVSMNVLGRLQCLRSVLNVKPPASVVYNGGRYCSKTDKNEECNSLPSILKHLTFKIKATGPITVAEYMKEVLTNPVKGYYMHQDMLGEHGDFVTSPEISQIFGELLGIWCISEWMACGKPKSLQLVELGPGRGTLIDDILRVFRQFGDLLKKCDISVHLVEVSPKLSDIQALKLTGKPIETEVDERSPEYKKGITKSGLPVCWYRDLQDVPEGFTFYIAHEFFDALPVHKLQKTKEGWREILIDIDPDVPEKLRFVLGSTSPLLAKTFIQDDEKRDHVEVCPSAAVIVQKLANRIRSCGGAALIADYGHFGDKTDTFRGFRGHQLHDVLIAPGTADLTADVDFSFLKRMIGDIAASLGPITQQEFLRNMGIDIRLKVKDIGLRIMLTLEYCPSKNDDNEIVLLDNSKDASMQQQLIHGYSTLMSPDKMGERFKFFSVLPHSRLENSKTNPKFKAPPVAGFSKLLLQ